MDYAITNQKILRDTFWREHPSLVRGSRSKTQNQYPTDTRVAWCDWVEACSRNGTISPALAHRATL